MQCAWAQRNALSFAGSCNANGDCHQPVPQRCAVRWLDGLFTVGCQQPGQLWQRNSHGTSTGRMLVHCVDIDIDIATP